MKRAFTLCLSLWLVFALVGCQQAEPSPAETYRVTVKDNYPIRNSLKASYRAGEQVTVELDTVAGQCYVLSVNGVQQEPTKTDVTATVFIFTMPRKHAVIDIKTVSAETPDEEPLFTYNKCIVTL